MSDLGSMLSHFQWLYKDEPQLAHKCALAFGELESGLQKLSSLGHHFHLEEGLQRIEIWPKVMYHYIQGQKLVLCEQDLRELGPGWRDSPLNAEIAEGQEIQFAGRGGVKRTTLPQTVSDNEALDLSPDFEQMKKEFLARNSGGKDGN